ncbi:FMN-binding negative transcriptional regulator [Ornithinimicrobium flavum]|uniref:FMN-binding negative transcriptional regulator n=1 Tax=Ornithinimicrobium flavum TaxID=1288636 RepID=UPI0013050A84|nr:FMN-binding negative transcriptional regulator [Ornithinimicrobium flavum]
MTDPDEVRRLIRNHPWATIVSPGTTGLVASHYPVILDESAEGPDITVLSHFGVPTTGCTSSGGTRSWSSSWGRTTTSRPAGTPPASSCRRGTT